MNPVPPDEHLRAALRHAPDAEVQAPAEVSAQILAAAHRHAAEVQRAGGRPLQGGWRLRWRAWGASGALATMLMAGVLGLLWRGDPPGPAVDESPAASVVAQAPAPTAPAAPAAPVAAQEAQAVAPPAVRNPPPAAAAPRTPPPPPPAAPAAVANPPPPGPAPMTAERQQQAADTANAAATGEASRRAVLSAKAEPSAEAGAARALASPAADTPPAAPMARLRAPPAPLTAPDAAWLDQLARATAGRWQPAAREPAAGALLLPTSAADAPRLWIEPTAVLRCAPAGGCERAPLDAETLRNLLDTLRR